MEIDKKKEGVFCVPEIDGMRVITTEKCEFWEKVDEALQITLCIGSFSPPALLLTANEGYIENSGSSGESIRSLQQSDQLLEAVEKLLQAASAEFDVDSQEKLLKAAAFGKTFLPPGMFDSNKLVEIVKNLKVLNNIRREWVARPLTYKQLLYTRSNGEILIKRLLESRYHYLAIQISKLWKLRVDEIYVNWACVKLIDQKYTDAQMCDLICEKLNSCKSVKYTDIARKALDYGRRELAINLLEHEPAISRKVPLLLYMKEYERALDKAIESSDPDDM
jgi:vacuolar protein sorting-associated protein 16